MTAGSTTTQLARDILLARARLNDAVTVGTLHEQHVEREWLESFQAQADLIFSEEQGS